jgi:hypothetical protein
LLFGGALEDAVEGIGEGRKLEASLASGQSLVADYTFDDTLTSNVGSAAPLERIGAPGFQTEPVDGVDQKVLAFAAGEGCRLLNASQTVGGAHTIVVLFRFASNTSWRRVIDYRNRKTDWGLGRILLKLRGRWCSKMGKRSRRF